MCCAAALSVKPRGQAARRQSVVFMCTAGRCPYWWCATVLMLDVCLQAVQITSLTELDIADVSTVLHSCTMAHSSCWQTAGRQRSSWYGLQSLLRSTAPSVTAHWIARFAACSCPTCASSVARPAPALCAPHACCLLCTSHPTAGEGMLAF